MTETSIALLSIICGISGAILTGLLIKKYSLGLTGNAIAGVFGGILLIKLIGRVGIDPISIMQSGVVNLTLLTINLLVSAIGGLSIVMVVSKIKRSYG